MTLKVPFFITSALLVAALTLFMPDFQLGAWAEEPVKGAPSSGAPRRLVSDRRMITAQSGEDLLTGLRIAHPEWRPLLALVEEALWEVERPEWRDVVPATADAGPGPEPLLSGAVIKLARRLIERWVRRVMATAANLGPEAAFAQAATARRIDPLCLFEAAVAHDVDRLDDVAQDAGDARGVLRGLAPLIAMPLLQACRRVWTHQTPGTWPHGHCPICGAWPTLAEIRGLDGARHLRCGAVAGTGRPSGSAAPSVASTTTRSSAL
jgi:FdhE protein